jgi:hypothetical protein
MGKSCFFSAARYLILFIVADDVISYSCIGKKCVGVYVIYKHPLSGLEVILFLLFLTQSSPIVFSVLITTCTSHFFNCGKLSLCLFDLLNFFVLSFSCITVLLQYLTYIHAYMSFLTPLKLCNKYEFDFCRLFSNLQKPFVVVYPSAFPKYGNLHL